MHWSVCLALALRMRICPASHSSPDRLLPRARGSQTGSTEYRTNVTSRGIRRLLPRAARTSSTRVVPGATRLYRRRLGGPPVPPSSRRPIVCQRRYRRCKQISRYDKNGIKLKEKLAMNDVTTRIESLQRRVHEMLVRL